MGKASAPPPPDYSAAATQTAAGNLQVAQQTAKANRPDQYAPQGQQTWQWGVGGDPDRAAVTTSLSPGQQQLYDSNLAGSQGLSQVGLDAIHRVGGILGQNANFSGIPSATEGNSRDAVTQALYNRSTAMLDPQYAQGEQRERQRLADAGFSQGDQGFGTAMGNFNRSKDAAYANARDSAIQAGGAEASRAYGVSADQRQKAIQEMMLQRQTPINEISALRSGSQVQAPTFQPYGQQANVAGPDLLSATQMGYNAQLGNTNAQNAQAGQTLSTLGGLGGAAMMATSMF